MATLKMQDTVMRWAWAAIKQACRTSWGLTNTRGACMYEHALPLLQLPQHDQLQVSCDEGLQCRKGAWAATWVLRNCTVGGSDRADAGRHGTLTPGICRHVFSC